MFHTTFASKNYLSNKASSLIFFQRSRIQQASHQKAPSNRCSSKEAGSSPDNTFISPLKTARNPWKPEGPQKNFGRSRFSARHLTPALETRGLGDHNAWPAEQPLKSGLVVRKKKVSHIIRLIRDVSLHNSVLSAAVALSFRPSGHSAKTRNISKASGFAALIWTLKISHQVLIRMSRFKS